MVVGASPSSSGVADLNRHDHRVHITRDGFAGDGHEAMFFVDGEDQAFCGIPLLREGRKRREQRCEQKQRESPAARFRKLEAASAHQRTFEDSLGWRAVRQQLRTRLDEREPFAVPGVSLLCCLPRLPEIGFSLPP
jgi:hypothetical protein